MDISECLKHFSDEWEILETPNNSNYDNNKVIYKAKKINGKINGVDVDICTIEILDIDKFNNKLINILSRLNDCQFSLKCYGYAKDMNKVYIYMEYIENSISIGQLIDKLPTKRIDGIFSNEIISHLIYILSGLHKIEITHGDISRNNFLLVTDNSGSAIGIKLVNFNTKSQISVNSKRSTYQYNGREKFEKVVLHCDKEIYSPDIKNLCDIIIGILDLENPMQDSPLICKELLKCNLSGHCFTHRAHVPSLSIYLMDGPTIERNKETLILPLFNNPLTIGSIRRGVQFLILPSYNHPIVAGSIPNSVSYLKLPYYNRPIICDTIPNSVNNLQLGSNFNNIESLSNLPLSIKYLKFDSENFNIKTSNITKFIKPSIRQLTINNEQIDTPSLFRENLSLYKSSDWEQINQSNNTIISNKLDGIVNGISVGTCAIKKCDNNEYIILEQLKNCEYVITSYGRGKDELGKIYFYREYIKDANTIKYKLNQQTNKRFEENEIIKLAIEITRALKIIHDNNIVHCNINCDHILIENKNGKESIKLVGFGNSKLLFKNDPWYIEKIGLETHMPPEVKSQNLLGSYKSDIWSLGCVLIEMAGGDLKQLNEFGIPLIPDHLSNHLRNIIQQCLIINRGGRFDAHRLLKHLDKNYFINKSKINLENEISYETMRNIPYNTFKLKLPNFNSSFQDIIVPFFIKTLSLPSFNMQLDQGSIPSSITKLKLKKFNQILSFEDTQVEYLDLGDEFDIYNNEYDILDEITTVNTLKIGYEFTKPINRKLLPRSVSKLKLTNYNVKIESNSIPPTITSLTLGSKFNDIASLLNLPKSIINLKFGTESKELVNITKYINPLITSLVVNGIQIETLLLLNPEINKTTIKKSTLLIHIENDWEIIEKIGNGAFGTVFKARNKNGNINGIQVDICIIKKVKKNEFRADEIHILDKLKDNQHSFKYYGCGIDNSDFIYIYMEFIEGVISIADLLKQLPNNRFEEHEIKLLAIEMVEALNSIHQSGVIHRDIKGCHILLSYDSHGKRIKGSTIKFIDFGLSKQFISSDTRFYSVVGTDSHMAPEVIEEKGKANRKSDIFCLGCTFIEMAGGELKTRNDNGDRIIPDHLSYGLKNIIQRCTFKNIDARVDINTLLNLLIGKETVNTNENDHFCLESFNEPLTIGIINDGIKSLSLPSFDSNIEIGSIPSSVTHLSFKVFNQEFQYEAIPSSVTSLDLGDEFDIQSNGDNTPDDTILTLRCGYQFKKPFPKKLIPQSVTNLKLTNYNLNIAGNSVPSTVVSLTLGSEFTHIESLSNLPTSITNLEFSTPIEIDKIDINNNKIFKTSITSIKINGKQRR